MIKEKFLQKNISLKKSVNLASSETRMMAILIRIPGKLKTLKAEDKRWFLSSHSALLSWLQDFSLKGDYTYELANLKNFEDSKNLFEAKDTNFFLKACEIDLPFDDSGENVLFLKRNLIFYINPLKLDT